MKTILFLCTLLFSVLHVHAAERESSFCTIDSLSNEKDQEMVFHVVEITASFPGGTDAMMKHIQEHLVYPEDALENVIEGIVVVEFIVEADGSLTNFKILRDIGGGCGEAALDVIKQMPNWEPAMHRGVPVRMFMKAPIKFKLQSASKKKK